MDDCADLVMNYDDVAGEYNRRYALHSYSGTRAALLDIAGCAAPHCARVLELGCGTGRWLSEFSRAGFDVAGIDPSREMLRRASAIVAGDLRRGYAEQLPWARESFDVVFCVNALHHFRSPVEAISEAHRVLRPDGAFVSIGLDPHAGPGTWYVYDFFEETLAYDLQRFPTKSQRIQWLPNTSPRRVGSRMPQPKEC